MRIILTCLKLFIPLIAFLICNVSNAQRSNQALLDSVELYLAKDEQKALKLLELAAYTAIKDSMNIPLASMPHARLYIAKNGNMSAFSENFWKRTIEFYKHELTYPEVMLFAYSKLVDFYRMQSLYEKAIEVSDSAIYYAKIHERPDLEIVFYSQKGIVFKVTSQYTKAKASLREAIRVAATAKAPVGVLIRNYIELGELFPVPQQIDSVFYYFNKSLYKSRLEKDFNNEHLVLRKIAEAYLSIEQYDSALAYSAVALKKSKTLDSATASISFYSASKINLKVGDYDKFQSLLDSSERYDPKRINKELEYRLLGLKGQYYALTENWEKANIFFENSLNGFREMGSKDAYITTALSYFELLFLAEKLSISPSMIAFMDQTFTVLKKLENSIAEKDKTTLQLAKTNLLYYNGQVDLAYKTLIKEYLTQSANYNNELVNKRIQIEGLQKLSESEKVIAKNKLELAEEKREAAIARSLFIGISLLALLLGVIALLYIRNIKQKREKLAMQKMLDEQKLLLAEKEIGGLIKTVDQNQKELTTYTLEIIEKNNLLNELSEKLNNAKSKQDIEKIERSIEFGLKEKNDWKEFKERFEKVNPQFLTNLKEKFPDLSKSQIKLASLIKLGFSSKQIAEFLNNTPASVDVARSKLRKKLDLTKETDLQDFLEHF